MVCSFCNCRAFGNLDQDVDQVLELLILPLLASEDQQVKEEAKYAVLCYFVRWVFVVIRRGPEWGGGGGGV